MNPVKRQYQKEMEMLLGLNEDGAGNAEADGGFGVPRVLLHACCAPCSSACVERICEAARVTVFFYDPNIAPEEEYRHRAAEEQRFLRAFNARRTEHPFYPAEFLEGDYDPERFYEAVKGLEQEPEGGARCVKCFRLRLEEAARCAAEGGYDYLTTTLTLSPLKDAELLNRIGEELCARYGIRWLPSDFKKKNGYLRSIRLSEEYGLYRQDYCGCIFSRRQREEARAKDTEVQA